MGKQKDIRFIGTINNMTGYVMNGVGYIRSKSSLTAERVKKDPAFRKTRKNSRKFGEASAFASKLHKTVPQKNRSLPLFRLITGMVVRGFRAAKSAAEIQQEFSSALPSLLVQVRKGL